jgi:glycosyltransferase involved in cell wall biosynthesis
MLVTVAGREFELRAVAGLRELVRGARDCDLILLNGAPGLVFALVSVFALWPPLRRPVVVADLVLRRPVGAVARVLAWVKRLLFARVDHFVHYFRDLAGYDRFFGIGPARSSYVPFKPNVADWPEAREAAVAEDYVFTLGVSLRDYATLFAAVAELGYPTVIPEYSYRNVEQRGRLGVLAERERLPANIRLAADEGGREGLVRNLARARVVVIPTYRESICASGIGTYLDAMWFGKCVVLSRGPGASDVLGDEAVLVPPEDPAALAAAIRRVWEDDAERNRVAARGRAYAAALGGERALIERVVAAAWAGIHAG